MRFEEIEIRWTRSSVKHIARHRIHPSEVEECVFDNEPIVYRTTREGEKRYLVLCQCPENGRYLLVVLTEPDEGGYVRVITVRDMTKEERKLYRRKR